MIKCRVTLGENAGDSRIHIIRALRKSFFVEYSGDRTYTMGLSQAKEKYDAMYTVGFCIMDLHEQDVRQLKYQGFRVENIDSGAKFSRMMVYKPNDGRLVQAVKDFRNATGLGLKESKHTIDEMWKTERPVHVKYFVWDASKVVCDLREKGFTVTGYMDDAFKDEKDLFEI